MSTIGISQPIINGVGGFSVTPSNTGLLKDDAGNTKAYLDDAYMISVGGAGNVKVTTVDGSVITFNGRSAGSELPMLVSQVFATGTTATAIIAIKGQ